MNRLKSQYAESANRSGVSFVASKSSSDRGNPKKSLPPRKHVSSPGVEPQYYGMRAPLRNKGFSNTPKNNKAAGTARSRSAERSASPSRTSQNNNTSRNTVASLYSTSTDGVYLTSELDFDNIDVTKLSTNEKDRLILNMMKEIDRLKGKVNNIVDDAELSLQQAIDSQETLAQEYQSKVSSLFYLYYFFTTITIIVIITILTKAPPPPPPLSPSPSLSLLPPRLGLQRAATQCSY